MVTSLFCRAIFQIQMEKLKRMYGFLPFQVIYRNDESKKPRKKSKQDSLICLEMIRYYFAHSTLQSTTTLRKMDITILPLMFCLFYPPSLPHFLVSASIFLVVFTPLHSPSTEACFISIISPCYLQYMKYKRRLLKLGPFEVC